MRSGRGALVAVLAVSACAAPPPVVAPAPAPDTTTQLRVEVPRDSARMARLIAAGMRSDAALDDLRHLTDVIGPRLTGSAEMTRAASWMAERLRAAGADSVWTEPITIEGWERGPITLRLVSPHTQWIAAASAGWAPGTNGPVTGDVVFVNARTLAEFRQRFAGRLRGAWVITRAPMPMFDAFAPSAADSAAVRAAREALFAPPASPDEAAFLAVRDSLLAVEGAAGTISSGDKERGLLTMFGSPFAGRAMPLLIVAHETFSQLHRLLSSGERVRLEADVRNRFAGERTATSVIADWRGTSRPEEIVLLGAHLDSWDLATGATDNGAGAVAVVNALRLLASAGERPDRTIRVALFTGEEQGLLGSRAYTARHAAELPRHQAVLVVDNGSGRVAGITLQGRDDLRAMWERLFAPLDSIGPFTIRAGVRTGSDHLPFLREHVPAYLLVQEWRSYDWTWHTQVDTFEHAIPDDLRQVSTVLAGLAWGLARADRLIPR